MGKKIEWLPYPKNDVLSGAFSYARYTKGMGEKTKFGMKNNLTLAILANKYFNSSRDENDEPIYTYNDEFLRLFVRKTIKGGRWGSFNQQYKSSISDEVFNITSEDLDVQGNICEKYFEHTNKHRKIIENENDSQFDDYRDINQEERTEYINNKLSKLTVHEKLQKLTPNDVMMDFHATSLYPSAMWDESSVYPKLETAFAFKPEMKKTYVNAFNNQTFNEDGDEPAILRIKQYHPPDIIFEHLPVKEKDENIEVNRIRNGYINATLKSIAICEFFETGAKVIEIYEGLIYRENFKISQFGKVREKLFALRQKYKVEKNNLMQELVILIMNNLYGAQIRRDINESDKSKSEHWMKTEDDDNVLDY